MSKTLLQKITSETDQVLALLNNLVEHESPTHRRDLVNQLGTFITDYLRPSGITPEVVPRSEVGDILWTEWKGSGAGFILVLCHIDTVFEVGSLKRNPFRVENSRIYGPGIFDMKSGVAATLKIQEYLSRGWLKAGKSIRFLYTTDEETTGAQSRKLIEDLARQCDLALVTEPPLPGGRLKTSRKGTAQYRIKIQGKAAHAGLDPDKGINAVDELARQILEIHSLHDPRQGTTIFVNMIRGGTASNVIAEYAQGRCDVRFRTMEEGTRVDDAMRRLRPHLAGARLQVEGGIERPPMVQTEAARALFERARAIGAELGLDLQGGESGGASDGNITAALGIPTLDGLGIPGDGAHAWHEHIELDALVPRIALLAKLVEKL